MDLKRLSKSLFRSKKGDNMISPMVIFIILNLIFFSALFYFVYSASNGVLVYEPLYSKQIALALDRAIPETNISIDFEKGIKIAEDKNKDFVKEELVTINNNKVLVNLDGKGGHSFRYFSEYGVSHYFDGNFLVLEIKDKKT